MYGGGYDPITLNLKEEGIYLDKSDDSLPVIVANTDAVFITLMNAWVDGGDTEVHDCCSFFTDILYLLFELGIDAIPVLKDLGMPEHLIPFLESIDASSLSYCSFNDTLVKFRSPERFAGIIMSKTMYAYYLAANEVIRGADRPFDEILAERQSYVDTLEWTECPYDIALLIPNYGAEFLKNCLRYEAIFFRSLTATSTYSLRKSGNPLFGRMLSRI